MAQGPVFSNVNSAFVIEPGFKWSQKAADDAYDKANFIHVGGETVTRRTLSGAAKKWENPTSVDRDNIFLLDNYRITGTPQAVTYALRAAGKTDGEIQQAINNQIDRNNYNVPQAQGGMAEIYDEELKRYEQLKGSRSPTEGYNVKQIIWFGTPEVLKNARAVSKSGEQKGEVTGGRKETRKSLSDRARSLAAGKVLDVSSFDPLTGTGATTKNQTKKSRTGAAKSSRLPIQSTNLENYISALRLIYGPNAEQDYAQDINEVRNQLAGPVVPTRLTVNPILPQTGVARPQQTLVPSQLGTAGATLAQAPQFRPVQSNVPRITSPRLGAGVGTIGGTQIQPMPRLATTFGQQ